MEDKEILITIQKTIMASPDLRNKKDSHLNKNCIYTALKMSFKQVAIPAFFFRFTMLQYDLIIVNIKF